MLSPLLSSLLAPPGLFTSLHSQEWGSLGGWGGSLSFQAGCAFIPILSHRSEVILSAPPVCLAFYVFLEFLRFFPGTSGLIKWQILATQSWRCHFSHSAACFYTHVHTQRLSKTLGTGVERAECRQPIVDKRPTSRNFQCGGRGSYVTFFF